MAAEMDRGDARAVADPELGIIVASVRVAAQPEQVFEMLVSDAVTQWWVRPGVFDTTEWSADLRVGGEWRASGTGRGRPYVLEGEFIEVDPPRKLAHTWLTAGETAVTTVTYTLEPVDGGTRLTLHHSGFIGG